MTQAQLDAAINEFKFTIMHLHDRLAGAASLAADLTAQLKEKDATIAKLTAGNVTKIKETK